MIEAKRGYIYEWNKEDSTRLVLVLSSNARSGDKLVSVLFVCDGESKGYDTISIDIDDDPRYVHTDLITYTSRSFLTREICSIDDDVMSHIENDVMRGLGISDYKTMYNDLLTWVARQS